MPRPRTMDAAEPTRGAAMSHGVGSVLDRALAADQCSLKNAKVQTGFLRRSHGEGLIR